MKRCANAEPGTYGHECGKLAQWTATNRHGHSAGFCDQCKATGHEAHTYKQWTPYEQAPMSSPSCAHGKGFKCRTCWPVQYWRTNP